MTRRRAALLAAGAGLLVLVLVLVLVLLPGRTPPARVDAPVPGTTTTAVAPCPGPATCPATGAGGLAVTVVPWSWTTELAFYQPPSPLPAAPPGTLIRIQHLAPGVRVPPDTVAWRILYHSTTATGADTAVSGMVFAPAWKPPVGGFPVVTYAHATTGLADQCAPSRFATPGIPSLASLIRAGDVVVATDYQGLGTPGPHPYVVGTSEAHAVLDAARAAREVPGLTVSARTVVLGYSQGGQAALFAGQEAVAYSPGLDLRGVVAEAPAVELPQLVEHLGTSSAFNGLFVTLAVSWSQVYPGLPLSDLLTPGAVARSSVTATGCETQIQEAYAKLRPNQVAAPGAAVGGPSGNKQWGDLLVANSPGGGPIDAPVLVVSGTKDTAVPPALTTRYVDRACATSRDRLTFTTYTGADHGTIITRAAGTVDGFIAARLAGTAVPAGCRRTVVPAP